MAIQKVAELRALPDAELQIQIQKAQTELHGLRLKARSGSVEQPHRLRETRRHIARLLTLFRERRTTP